MNGRKPTVGEALYINACVCTVGCIACILDGREIENPQAWTEFHHDPDFGSEKPGAHYHGYGLCAVHHRGVFAGRGVAALANVSVRHPAYGSNSTPFAWRYGTDAELCQKAWELLPASVREQLSFDRNEGEPDEV